ncbi:hypothetical protein BJX65DRAFT_272620, partial [Aspergillus insuetus]
MHTAHPNCRIARERQPLHLPPDRFISNALFRLTLLSQLRRPIPVLKLRRPSLSDSSYPIPLCIIKIAAAPRNIYSAVAGLGVALRSCDICLRNFALLEVYYKYRLARF